MEERKVTWPGWENVRLIGRGSFGGVYEIQRDVFGERERAALKVISIPQNESDVRELYADGYDDESIAKTFQDYLKNIVAEYSLMRKMNGSANVVNCDDFRYEARQGGVGWNIYIKMELLTPLVDALPAVIKEDQVIKIAKDMCAALELCSKYKIIHRDIKPQNIFYSKNGDYKLGDFGIAKTVEKTTGGTKAGTPKYMAPEVYHNKPYNHTADIYSLGLVLYWLLNERRLPFLPLPPQKLGKDMEEEAKSKRLDGAKLPPPAHGSKRLKQIVLKACAYNPKARYQSAQEMADELAALDASASGPDIGKGLGKIHKTQETKGKTPETKGKTPETKGKGQGKADDRTDSRHGGGENVIEISLNDGGSVGGTSRGGRNTGGRNTRGRTGREPNPPHPGTGRILLVVLAVVLVAAAGIWAFLSFSGGESVLMADMVSMNYDASQGAYTDQPVFGSQIMRSQIQKITFSDSLKNAPKSAWDVSQKQNGSVLAWVEKNGNLYDLYIAGRGGVVAPENCSGLFALYTNLEKVTFYNYFLTEAVTDMSYMFFQCKSLEYIYYDVFDTSAVTNMKNMFADCSSLKRLDVSGFDTANVTDMSGMFSYNSQLKSLDVSGFNTSKVTDMMNMFAACTSLNYLDVRGFDTANVTDMSGMFVMCQSLPKLDVSGFNTAKVTRMRSMFSGCRGLLVWSEELGGYAFTAVDVGGFDVSRVQDWDKFLWLDDKDIYVQAEPWETMFAGNRNG